MRDPRTSRRRLRTPIGPIEVEVLRTLIEREISPTVAGRVVHAYQKPPCDRCERGSCDSAATDGLAVLGRLESRWLARRVGHRLWTAEDRLRPRTAATIPAREPSRELLWLLRAQASAGAESGFTDHAVRRLAAGQELHGDRWADLGFERLLTELEDQAADIGAWGVLALQVVEADPNISDVMRDHIGLLVHVAMALGAYSYEALTLARSDLEQPGSPYAV